MNIDTNRTIELRQMLMARRLELGSIVHSGIRDGRRRQSRDVGDLEEDSATCTRSTLTCLSSKFGRSRSGASTRR